MQGPKWSLFYLHVDLVWSLLIVGTGFVPWVELPVQRRLCPIFVSGVGLPDIHDYSADLRVVNWTPKNGASQHKPHKQSVDYPKHVSKFQHFSPNFRD